MRQGPTVSEHAVRLLLVDPHDDARSRIAERVRAEPDLELVAEEAAPAVGFARVLSTDPDVVVACVGDDERALHLCRDMRASRPEVACVIASDGGGDAGLVRAILAGATAVARSHDEEDVVAAVRRAVAGEAPLLTAIRERIDAGLPRPSSDPLSGLTEQQRAVAELVALGRTNNEIGSALHLSANTVRNYLSVVMARLGARNRAEVASFLVYLAAQRAADASGEQA
jgi:two-component system response regulator DevR